MDLLFLYPLPPDYDKWEGIKLYDLLVNHMHSDTLYKLIHKKCLSIFRGTYTELFDHIEIRKCNISLKIGNHLPAMLPNQIYNMNKEWF